MTIKDFLIKDLKLGDNYIFEKELDIKDEKFLLRSKSDFINRDSLYNDFNFYSQKNFLFIKLRHVIDESRDDIFLFRLFKKDKWNKKIAKKLNDSFFYIEEDDEGNKLEYPRKYFLNEIVNVPLILNLKLLYLLNKNKKTIISETKPTTMWEFHRISEKNKETIIIELDQTTKKYQIFHGISIDLDPDSIKKLPSDF